MSLGIVIPLKSKLVSEDWSITCSLLNSTLDSLRNQKSKDFHVVVVCHEMPEISEVNKSLAEFISSPFDLPKLQPNEVITHYKQIDYILDKNRKLALGLKSLSLKNVDYYMVLDADDLLHKDLIEIVLDKKDSNGYILNDGYEYFIKYNKIIQRSDMAKICGSTTIIHKRHIHLEYEIKDENIGVLPWCFLSHSHMESYYEERNFPLSNLPFPALMYKLAHGQNASDEFRQGLKTKIKLQLKLWIKGKKVSDKIKSDFSI